MKKLRLFAGPNGSGKSTLFATLKKSRKIRTDIYVNADKFEKILSQKCEFNFNPYRIRVSQQEFITHIKSSGLYKKFGAAIDTHLKLEGGILTVLLEKKKINSYLASFVASFLVEKLIESGQSFSFETVMSHESKLDLLMKARKSGYKNYLYFITTSDYTVNIDRVKQRVEEGGHNVDEEKVKSRFYRSLSLLQPAVQLCNRSYIIDNSENFDLLLEIENGNTIKYRAEKMPGWLAKYLDIKTLKQG